MQAQSTCHTRRRSSASPVVHRYERDFPAMAPGEDGALCASVGEVMFAAALEAESPKLAYALRKAAVSLVAWGRRG
jgi:hypothetical protein